MSARLIDVYMDLASAAAQIRKAGQAAEWDRLEAVDGTPVASTHAGNGEQRFVRARCSTEPTEAESDAFLAWERDALGIDRRTGAIRRIR